MGGPTGKPAAFSADDDLAWETTQTGRHEYMNGEVFAMEGAEDWHVTATMSPAFALRQHLAKGETVTLASVGLVMTAEQLFAEVPEV